MKRVMSVEWDTCANLIPDGVRARAQQWLDAFPEQFDLIEVAPHFVRNDNGFPVRYDGALETRLMEKPDHASKRAYVACLVSDVLVEGSLSDLAREYAKRARYAFDNLYREKVAA